MSIRRDQTIALLNTLSDIRHIELMKLPFSDEFKRQKFILNLPSNRGNKTEEMKKMLATAKKRKPGEIPEWKKQRLKQNNDNCQKTG